MKIALLFPGYGSQFVGMAKELYDQHRIIQEQFEEASSCLDVNLVKLCFASSDTELSQISNAYPALFVVTSSIALLLREHGIAADVVAGYADGEYAALCAAGGINLPDGLYFLKKLAGFSQALFDEGSYAAVRVSGPSAQELEQACLEVNKGRERGVFIAVYLTDSQHIVSGDTEAVDLLTGLLGKRDGGVGIENTAIQLGLHSPLMNGVVDQVKPYLEKLDFKLLQTPLLESVEAKPIQGAEDVRIQLIKNSNHPIHWSRVMSKLGEYDIILSAGPGNMLCDLAREAYPEKIVMTVATQDDLEELKGLVAQEKSSVRKSVAPEEEATQADASGQTEGDAD